jgi:hypothetical protein
MSQFLSKWSEMGKNEHRRGDFNTSTFSMISGYIEPKYFYDLIIKDKRYKLFKGIKREDLISFEDPLNCYEDRQKLTDIAKVGNEHSDEFRQVVAQRFIYLFENTPAEAETAKP